MLKSMRLRLLTVEGGKPRLAIEEAAVLTAILDVSTVSDSFRMTGAELVILSLGTVKTRDEAVMLRRRTVEPEAVKAWGTAGRVCA